MAVSPQGVVYTTPDDSFGPRNAADALSLAGRIVVPVANETARDDVAAGADPTTSEPLIVWRQDLRSLQVTTDGTTWETLARTQGIPRAMASGVVAIPGGSGTPTSAAVTFPTGRFTAAPDVQVSVRTAAINAVTGWGASDVTASGCNLHVLRAGSTSTAVVWLAVQMVD